MDDGAYRRSRGGRTEMSKRKKFHELRYPKSGVLRGRKSAKQAKETVIPYPVASESTSGEIDVSEEIEREERRMRGVTRIARMHGGNVPDPEDVKIVENRRGGYDGSGMIGHSLKDSLIMLTDIETGFFRECVAKDGGGWYGDPNHSHLEKYGLNPRVYNERALKAEHLPVVQEREREDLLLRLIYRKAYHRATANIPVFGKSTGILVQECWFKCYLPWTCLDRNIPRSVEVANKILQELEPEITQQAQTVQAKIKAELKLRKASGEYDDDVALGPAGVPEWVDLPIPQTRDELNRLEAFYEEDRAADRRVKDKEDAHDQGKIGPIGSYSADDVWDRETSLEDLQKQVATRKW